MRRKTASDLTFKAIRKTVEKEVKEDDHEEILFAASLVVGTVLAIGGVVAAGAAALGLLAGKDEAFKVANTLLSKSRIRRGEGARERHQRMLVAHQLLVYAAFLDAADEILQVVKDHAPRGVEATMLDALARTETSDELVPLGDRSRDQLKAELIAHAPHPADSLEGYGRDLYTFYSDLTDKLGRFVEERPELADLSDAERARIGAVLDTLASESVNRYTDQHYALVADNPGFAAWVQLRDTAATRTQLQRLPDDVARRVLEIVTAPPVVSLLTEQLEALPTVGRRFHANEVRAELAEKYRAKVARPIVDRTVAPRPGVPQIVYPRRDQAFIPQAFQVIRTTASKAGRLRFENEHTWQSVPVREDLESFLLQYLQSSYSASAPLVILGDPGSGKSLLSEMLAAGADAEGFTAIRLELRGVDVSKPVYRQLARQIEDETNGQRISWADFSKEISDKPPLAIFDGFDELLRSADTTHSGYLDAVQAFQNEEIELSREVRAVVTSRTNLIDKAHVPPGATVVRLLDFDASRRDAWIEMWNRANKGYFRQTRVKRFALPARRADVIELAGQPLLLFLLALFDAEGNQLRDAADVDRAQLYNDLLVSFLERERDKGGSEAIGADMRRLGIAAMSMFNRRTVYVSREQLREDLRFYAGDAAAMEDAERLFREFFFVHMSRSRSGDAGTEADWPEAYEFLHNTFGEFLAADRILRRLVEEMRDRVQLHPALDATQRLGEDWHANLMYTALYTRPVVLEMMRSWLPHLLVEYGLQPEEFAACLDEFVRAEIAEILDATSPRRAFTENSAPYERLPLWGHVAIYTLNLVMLRIFVSGEPFGLCDAADDAIAPGRTSTWHQLSQIWRMWFPLDHLSALASVITSEPSGDTIVIQARDSLGAPTGTARLETAWRAAAVLGDRLTAGALAAHLHDAGDRHPMALLEVRNGLEAAEVDLDLELLMRAVRSDGWPREDRPKESLVGHAKRAVALSATSRSHRDLLIALTAPDAPLDLRAAAGHAMSEPRFVERLWSLPDSFAAAYIRFCASISPRWAAQMSVETLLRDDAHELGEASPEAFAACIDGALPTEGVAYAVVGHEDAARRLAPAILGLLQRNVEPVVLAALMDLSMRVADECGDSGPAGAAVDRLIDQTSRSTCQALSIDRLRRLISLAGNSADGRLARWLLAGTETDRSLKSLPSDIVIECDLLALKLTGSRRISGGAIDGWPLLHTSDEGALVRLLAWLEPTDDATGMLGRRGVISRLTTPDATRPTLRLTPLLRSALEGRADAA